MRKRLKFKKVERRNIIRLSKADARFIGKALMGPAPAPSPALVAMMQLAKQVFGNSRPMTGAESEALDEAFKEGLSSSSTIPGML